MADPIHIVCPGVRQPEPRAGRPGPARGEVRALQGGALHRRADALTGEPFRKHVQASDIPLVVDFWAGWCGPCRAMAPVFARAAGALEPRARFVKIDLDKEPALAAEYGVQGIPALFMVKGGKVVERHAGMAEASLFQRWLAQAQP